MRNRVFNGTVYIHLGPHKTGTTSIQSFFSENYASLVSHGLLYPRAGRIHNKRTRNAHHHLVTSILENAEDEIEKFLRELAEEIAVHKPQKILLSTEVLAREWLTKDVFETLQNFFPHSTRVWIAVLRRQDDLLLSHYQEGVKRNSIKSPNDGKSRGRFTSTSQISQLDRPEILDHSRRLEKIQSHVGGDEMRPLLFEAIKQNLHQAILQITEVAFDNSFRLPARKNESLPWRVLYALQAVNRLPEPLSSRTSKAIRTGTRIAAKLGLQPLLAGSAPLSKADRRNVMAKYAVSNRRVCERYFTHDDVRYL